MPVERPLRLYTYNGKSIFDDFDCTQSEWQTNPSKLDLSIETLHEKVSNYFRKHPVESNESGDFY